MNTHKNRKYIVKRTALIVILLGLAIGPARVARASQFHVVPIRVDFNGSTNTALLTLTNQSSEDLRFQVRAFQWGQDAKGDMDLKPTNDIIFFPALLTLKPGEERKVRIGSKAHPTAVEQTYRVFFEELPPLEKPEDQKGAQVRIVTRMGVPVFIEPVSRKASADVANFAAQYGKLTFDVKNAGNVHFVAQHVRVIATDAAGKSVFDKQRDGWYVLAGGMRSYDLDLTPAECASIKSVAVEVMTDLSTKPEEALVKRTFAVPANNCSK
jgi:fimbrial chaperone protein